MGEQLYPLESFTTRERLEVARFGIFDDPPAVDVAALVAAIRAGLDEGESADQFITADRGLWGDPPSAALAVIEKARTALAALVSLSRPVRPPREAVLNIVYGELSHMEQPGSAVMFMNASSVTDALRADADLWQPAPVMDRDALAQKLFTLDYPTSAYVLFDWNTAVEPTRSRYFAKADALLPFIGQPVSSEVEEAERMRGVLDRHLPTIITGLSHVVHGGIGYKARDERTPEEVAIMAALSAAHWIAKEIATGSGEPLYDLPGVLDLLEVNRRIQADRDASNPYQGQPVSPRTVTTEAELDALPVGSVIRSGHGQILERRDDRWYGTTANYATPRPSLPASVLYVPSEGVES